MIRRYDKGGNIAIRYYAQQDVLRNVGRELDKDGTYPGAGILTVVTMVKTVESEGEWAELVEQSTRKVVVVDFTASW